MALIKCPECNKDVSDRAAACPHCGCPLKEEIKGERRVEIRREPIRTEPIRTEPLQPKKRFSSREYKMNGFISSITCSLILLIFLLTITFDNYILSVGIALVYGLTIFLLSKFLLTTKPKVKKYLLLVIVIIASPLLITFFLLTQSEIYEYTGDKVVYRYEINSINGCRYYLRTNDVVAQSTTCKYTKKDDTYTFDITINDNKQEPINCMKKDGKLICPNYDKRYSSVVYLDKK